MGKANKNNLSSGKVPPTLLEPDDGGRFQTMLRKISKRSHTSDESTTDTMNASANFSEDLKKDSSSVIVEKKSMSGGRIGASLGKAARSLLKLFPRESTSYCNYDHVLVSLTIKSCMSFGDTVTVGQDFLIFLLVEGCSTTNYDVWLAEGRRRHKNKPVYVVHDPQRKDEAMAIFGAKSPDFEINFIESDNLYDLVHDVLVNDLREQEDLQLPFTKKSRCCCVGE